MLSGIFSEYRVIVVVCWLIGNKLVIILCVGGVLFVFLIFILSLYNVSC